MLTDECGDHFLTWLTKYFRTTSEGFDIRRIPDTELRRSMIRSSLPPSERFMEMIMEAEGDTGDDRWRRMAFAAPGGSQKDMTVNKNCLFAAFVSWCETREEKKISCNLFFRQIQQLKEQEYRPELDGARPTCWVLKVPAAKKRGIKRHLGDE